MNANDLVISPAHRSFKKRHILERRATREAGEAN